jgi:hypothetical protein
MKLELNDYEAEALRRSLWLGVEEWGREVAYQRMVGRHVAAGRFQMRADTSLEVLKRLRVEEKPDAG